MNPRLVARPLRGSVRGDCLAKALIKRRLTLWEIMAEVERGVHTDGRLTHGYCSRTVGHDGPHRYHRAAWFYTRTAARWSVLLIAVLAFITVGALDSPSLH